VCRRCIVEIVNKRDDLRSERQAKGLCRCSRALDGERWRLCARCRLWSRDAMRARRRRTREALRPVVVQLALPMVDDDQDDEGCGPPDTAPDGPTLDPQ
jgi:hypothetical protein